MHRSVWHLWDGRAEGPSWRHTAWLTDQWFPTRRQHADMVCPFCLLLIRAIVRGPRGPWPVPAGYGSYTWATGEAAETSPPARPHSRESYSPPTTLTTLPQALHHARPPSCLLLTLAPPLCAPLRRESSSSVGGDLRAMRASLASPLSSTSTSPFPPSAPFGSSRPLGGASPFGTAIPTNGPTASLLREASRLRDCLQETQRTLLQGAAADEATRAQMEEQIR